VLHLFALLLEFYHLLSLRALSHLNQMILALVLYSALLQFGLYYSFFFDQRVDVRHFCLDLLAAILQFYFKLLDLFL
jgi:hypothetical protein